MHLWRLLKSAERECNQYFGTFIGKWLASEKLSHPDSKAKFAVNSHGIENWNMV